MLSVRATATVVVLVVAVLSRGTAFLDGLEPSLSGATLVSLTLKLLCSRLISVRVRSVPVRVFRPAVRPMVLPVALPTVPRVAAFGSRTLVTFSAGRLLVLLVPIVRPVREVDFTADERWLVADCFFAAGIEGVLLPITVPIFRLCPVRDGRLLLFTLDGVEGLVELTAGCLAPLGAEELREPIVVPIRERWLVVGCFFAFEAGGVLRLLELPIREATLERAAGCLALLGTDGLVVLIVLPIREVLLGLIRLLVLVVDLLVVAVRDLLLGWFLVLLEEIERLLAGVLVLIELPIRDVMLELMRPFELVLGEAVELRLLELLLLLVILRLDVDEFGRVVICRPRVLELGAVCRELIDRLDVLLLGVRLDIDLLEMLRLGVRLEMLLLELLLLLGVRLDMDLLEILLLGVRLDIDLLEVLLLGVRLDIDLLELRLDEMLLELLDDDLDDTLGAGAGLETDRLELLDLLDLLLLDRDDRAAKTGSENSKRATKMHKTRKRELFQRGFEVLIFDFPVRDGLRH